MLHILLSVCVVSVDLNDLVEPDHNYNFSIIILHWDWAGCYYHYYYCKSLCVEAEASLSSSCRLVVSRMHNR